MSGLFASLLGTEKRNLSVYVEAMEKNREAAGSVVTPNSAMRMAAVYACVRILAETVGSLPLIVYERLERGKRRAPNHYLYPILHDRPNELMTAFEFRETVQSHLALWGNAYIQVEYDGRGRVRSLWPLLPGNMLDQRVEGDRRYYWYQLPNGEMRWLTSDVIWHLRGLAGDGLTGYSPIGLVRRAISLGMDAEKFGERFFQNDARPGIILEHPGKLNDEAHKRLKESWKEEHEGVDKSHRISILEEGMTLHEVGIPPEDAQFLETRKFQVNEIARVFRVPPHMLADLDRATFSNIEHQSIDFVVHTIRPWLVRWEQSIDQNLMLARDRKRYFTEFLVDGLLRGDTESRYQAYAQARQNGWLSANDIREMENMNPVEGGDIYLVPLNMVAAPSVGEPSTNDEPSTNEDTNTRMDPRIETNTRMAITGVAEERSAVMRARLRGSYLEIYRDTARRILRREAGDIRRQMKKTLRSRGLMEFMVWLDDYYLGHVDYVKRQMLTVNLAYGKAVSEEAMDEVNAGEEEDITARVQRFIDSYTGGYAARHVGISEDLIRKAVARSQVEEIEVEQAIDEELDNWDEGRAGGIAEEESTRFNNALAKTVFVIAGVQYIRSVAIGDSCPYCKALDGRVIGVNELFLSAGEEFQPEGADVPLTTTTNIGHPPYHGGCDCYIVASL